MSKCSCYFGCKKNRSLHKFPPKEYPHTEKYNQWMAILHPETVKRGDNYIHNTIRLCSRHFEHYYLIGRKNRLTKNAVPTLNLGKSNVTLHGFPNPDIEPDRFRTWLYAVGGDLLGLENRKIYKNRKVCHEHFKKEYHTRSCRLSCNAVPTLNLKEFTADRLERLKQQNTGSQKDTLEGKSGQPLHLFPNPKKDLERFEVWKYTIGGEILSLDNQRIYKLRRVCHNHFELKYRNRCDLLAANAVPTSNLPGIKTAESNDFSLSVNKEEEKETVIDLENSETKEDVEDESQYYHKNWPSNFLYNAAGVGEQADETFGVIKTTQNKEVSLSVKKDEEKENEAVTVIDLDDSLRDDNDEQQVKQEFTFSWQQSAEELHDVDAERLPSQTNREVLSLDSDEDDCNGFVCNVCLSKIEGLRYVCLQCTDCDLCSWCDGAPAHATHYVLRVPSCKPTSEVQARLDAIRRALSMDVTIETTYSAPVKIKEEKLDEEQKFDEEPMEIEYLDPEYLDPIVPQSETYTHVLDLSDTELVPSETELGLSENQLSPSGTEIDPNETELYASVPESYPKKTDSQAKVPKLSTNVSESNKRVPELSQTNVPEFPPKMPKDTALDTEKKKSGIIKFDMNESRMKKRIKDDPIGKKTDQTAWKKTWTCSMHNNAAQSEAPAVRDNSTGTNILCNKQAVVQVERLNSAIMAALERVKRRRLDGRSVVILAKTTS